MTKAKTPDHTVIVPKMMTLDDLAVYFECSRRTVDNIRKQEGFPKSVTGTGHPRYLATAVIAWLEAESVSA